MSTNTPGRTRSGPRLPLWFLALLLLALGVWQFTRSQPSSAPPPIAPPATSPNAPESPAASTPDADRAGPTRDLSRDEARGGHTLARHVGRSDAELRDRLSREPGISAASTYTDRAVAEVTVGRTLSRSAGRITSWLARGANRPNLALDYRGSPAELIGRSLPRGRPTSVPCTDAVVVLRADGQTGYYVLTSYPEIRR